MNCRSSTTRRALAMLTNTTMQTLRRRQSLLNLLLNIIYWLLEDAAPAASELLPLDWSFNFPFFPFEPFPPPSNCSAFWFPPPCRLPSFDFRSRNSSCSRIWCMNASAHTGGQSLLCWGSRKSGRTCLPKLAKGGASSSEPALASTQDPRSMATWSRLARYNRRRALASSTRPPSRLSNAPPRAHTVRTVPLRFGIRLRCSAHPRNVGAGAPEPGATSCDPQSSNIRCFIASYSSRGDSFTEPSSTPVAPGRSSLSSSCWCWNWNCRHSLRLRPMHLPTTSPFCVLDRSIDPQSLSTSARQQSWARSELPLLQLPPVRLPPLTPLVDSAVSSRLSLLLHEAGLANPSSSAASSEQTPVKVCLLDACIQSSCNHLRIQTLQPIV